MKENSVTIGKARFLKEYDTVYFIGNNGKINLSDYDAKGFIINSNGDLLYSVITPMGKEETVFVTPKGQKYHVDAYCAGKTGFEIPFETAKMLEREACKICT